MNGWQIAAERFGVLLGNHSWDEYDDDGNFVQAVIYWGPDITGGEPRVMTLGWPLERGPDKVTTSAIVEDCQKIGEYDRNLRREQIGPVRWASPDIAARMGESWPN